MQLANKNFSMRNNRYNSKAKLYFTFHLFMFPFSPLNSNFIGFYYSENIFK